MKQKLVSFVLAETPGTKKGEISELQPLQSAPQYFAASVPRQYIFEERKDFIKDREVIFVIKAYLPDVVLVEATIEVNDVFSAETFELREALIDACHHIIKSHGGKQELAEEYSVALVSDYTGDPEQFFDKSSQIASFLKSEKLPLDEKEIEYTLSSQIKYTQDDLIIVDWDGAFIFDPRGEFEPIIELFQIANLQLLRHRALDSDLDIRIKKIGKFIRGQAGKVTLLRSRELMQAFREVIAIRSRSISEFEAMDRDIKLIGDWYSARLYDLAAKKFKLEAWKQSIKEKLDSLEDVYSIVSENFSISRLQLLELVQIGLFFILQVGWFVLIILEFIYFTR
ncbi:MAG: hypothetical protein A2745_02295 [Candidatus Harrisonbacteria bacterium RIFCSPHIGHO2_01_FULL_44_13]|uniref:DUF155 domain-containing protein n=1 Tax=Candidatus Harrisonbacteria bacterium RIFCSPLOWO2_01_FULL_44_18 TaxID=1798407 RepID=A0A1G1ZNT0_9BACT|nr:MAG: hypothetical protein A2745_02295 [Candidatus Harrisonbacteria bacterium RIFCSPHIGHO2_01_FULL_44_13]OGY66161.1 MAG: hypothetical protein A3A16_02560 [Candidatus Harrisonbacteria bacterium RIFCSPLOWO2_01_FULL_44_18]